MEKRKKKTSAEIEAIKERMRQDPSQANFADNVIDPNTPEGKIKIANFQSAGTKAAAEKAKQLREKKARIEAKAEEMEELLAAIRQTTQSPSDIMLLLMHEAMDRGDSEEAFKIAKEMREYDESKKQRIESVVVQKTLADMSPEELEELARLEDELGDDSNDME